MCMFCVAIPTVAALGSAANARQMRASRAAAERGETKTAARPLKLLTGGAIVLLACGSAWYHSQVQIY
ncbi:MAG: hypothetical protein OHK0031_18800 [Anaerolineales bacterium]